MKKYIAIVTISALLFLIPSLSFAQATPADSTKVTWSKVYEDAKAGLTGLAEALKVGAEHVYEVLVRQQVVGSITKLIVYIVFILTITVLLIKGANLFKKYEKDHNDDTMTLSMWCMIPGVIIGIIFLIYFFATIGSCVTGFVNPEYGAIKDILEWVK